MRGVFVTGTDTGVGKSVVSAAVVAAMRVAGVRAGAFKPVLTGLQEAPAGRWPADHELLGAAAGLPSEQVAPLRLAAAASPHLAARLEGVSVEPERLLDDARRAAARCEILVVEGVGGLLVPLAEDYLVCDLARALALPLVIAARPGLGTINHTLLTLRAARAAGLDVRAVVLTPWPRSPGELELSNRETIARLGDVEVATLEQLAGPDRAALARAGAGLPWRSWLHEHAAVA